MNPMDRRSCMMHFTKPPGPQHQMLVLSRSPALLLIRAAVIYAPLEELKW